MQITAELVEKVRDAIAANTPLDPEQPDWDAALYVVDEFLTDWIDELKEQEGE
jgi:hypothetical protein